MASYLTLFITVPLTFLAVLFAVSNTGDTQVYLYPGAEVTTVPVYLLGLGILVGGFLAGALFVGAHAQRTNFRYWQEKKKSARLEKELDALHQKTEAVVPSKNLLLK